MSTSQIERATKIIIDINNIDKNLKSIKDYTDGKIIMAIVKANAYGHGIVEVSRAIQNNSHTNQLGVAFIEEAEKLRKNGITLPILVMGSFMKEQIYKFLNCNVEITVSSIDKLHHVNKIAKNLNKIAVIHLKVDTGLGRIGVHENTALDLINQSLLCESVTVKGIYSHFSTSEDTDSDYTDIQLKRFIKVCNHYKILGIPTPIRHIANSGAIINYRDSHLDMVRPGLLIYGVYPSIQSDRTLRLSAVLSLITKVAFFKVVEKGRSISYGANWSAKHSVRVVTLPIGYGDGYPRILSNTGKVIINGEKYKIVGNICMDLLMVNIEQGTAYNGDEVILIGDDGSKSINVEELAEIANTIPHHILTGLNNRIQRYYL